jgi:hypothetical protein
MKSEIRNNCEYLLNMPTHKKREALFNSQLRKHCPSKKDLPKYSHSELAECQLTRIKIESNVSFETGGKGEK